MFQHTWHVQFSNNFNLWPMWMNGPWHIDIVLRAALASTTFQLTDKIHSQGQCTGQSLRCSGLQGWWEPCVTWQWHQHLHCFPTCSVWPKTECWLQAEIIDCQHILHFFVANEVLSANKHLSLRFMFDIYAQQWRCGNLTLHLGRIQMKWVMHVSSMLQSSLSLSGTPSPAPFLAESLIQARPHPPGRLLLTNRMTHSVTVCLFQLKFFAL